MLQTGLKLYEACKQENRFISFGDSKIDELLGGGIYTRGITEIVGEAGAGKTQMCLLLALQTILQSHLRGENGCVAILSCGEGLFPISRLLQLAQHYASQQQDQSTLSTENPAVSPIPALAAEGFMQRVHITQCANCEELMEIMKTHLPPLIPQLPVRLVIVDSIGGLLRGEGGEISRGGIERAALLFSLSSYCRTLSDTFNLPFLMVNQVTAGAASSNFNTGESSWGAGLQGSEGETLPPWMAESGGPTPALGLAWGYCVNTRIYLKRLAARHDHGDDTDASASAGISSNATLRSLHLLLSPHRAPSSLHYRITSRGIESVS
eukprot:gene23917-28960_t